MGNTHWELVTCSISQGELEVGGLKSIETEYKLTKVKAAVRLYNNSDPTMELVRQYE